MLFAYGSNHLGVFVEPFFVCSCFSYLFLNRLAAIVLFFFVPHSFESLIRHSLENCIDHSLLMSFSSGSFLKQWTSWCFAGFSGHLDENYKEVSVIKKIKLFFSSFFRCFMWSEFRLNQLVYKVPRTPLSTRYQVSELARLSNTDHLDHPPWLTGREILAEFTIWIE